MSEQTTLRAIRDELFPRAYEIELDGQAVWVDASIAGDIQGPLMDIAVQRLREQGSVLSSGRGRAASWAVK